MFKNRPKTILINPPYSLEDRYGSQIKAFGALSEPMGLAYLASSLERGGFSVEILDAQVLELTQADVVEYVKQSHAEVIGITFLTPMFNAVREMTNAIKHACPRIKIIVGGAHPTALSEKTIEECPSIDYACIGEGESMILDFLKFMAGEKNLEEVPSLVYRCNGRIIKNPSAGFVKEIDNLPKPARHLLSMDRYKLTASRTKYSRFCPTIILARGCPFDCQFCSHPFGRTFRHHSVDRIIEEIKDIQSQYQANQFNFEADTITLDRKFIIELCDAIIEEKLNIRWTCESRVDTVDEMMLKKMKDAGCWQISYGVESGCQRLLDIIHKGVKKEDVVKVFNSTQNMGISIRGFFILGLPSETPEESMETINFAKSLNALWAQFTLTTPYPGTPMFDQLQAQGKIRHHRWADYNTWGGWAGKSLPYVPEGRTEDELKNLQKKAMRLYYMRPNMLLRHIKGISSIEDLKKIFKGGFILLRNAIGLKFRNS